MTLVRWSPSRSIFNLKSDMDRVFENFLNTDWDLSERFGDVTPVMDVEETENDYRISAELPGLKKEDVKITFQNNTLTISGEKKAEKEKKEDSYHRMERTYGKFSRSVHIPGQVMADKIDAEFKDGVLNISLPKSEEAKPKQIEVKVK